MTSSQEPARVSALRTRLIGLAAVALWMLLSVAVVAHADGDLKALRRLGERGRATTGVVRSIWRGRSSSVTVEFAVDGRTHTVASGRFGPPNPPIQVLRVGQQIAVWYLPEDPEVIALGDPPQLLRLTGRVVSFIIGLLFVSILGSTWILTRLRLPPRQRSG